MPKKSLNSSETSETPSNSKLRTFMKGKFAIPVGAFIGLLGLSASNSDEKAKAPTQHPVALKTREEVANTLHEPLRAIAEQNQNTRNTNNDSENTASETTKNHQQQAEQGDDSSENIHQILESLKNSPLDRRTLSEHLELIADSHKESPIHYSDIETLIQTAVESFLEQHPDLSISSIGFNEDLGRIKRTLGIRLFSILTEDDVIWQAFTQEVARREQQEAIQEPTREEKLSLFLMKGMRRIATSEARGRLRESMDELRRIASNSNNHNLVQERKREAQNELDALRRVADNPEEIARIEEIQRELSGF